MVENRSEMQAMPSRYVCLKINRHDINQIEALNKLQTRAEYIPYVDVFKVDRFEYKHIDELKQLQFLELPEAQKKYDAALNAGILDPYADKLMVDHTKSLIDAEEEKIYLHTVNWHVLKIINDPENKGIFGHDGKHFYIKKFYAEQPKWHKLVQRCSKGVLITATMFKSPSSKHAPTPGMEALADAFNIEDRAERAKALAEACALCARERIDRVPGAVQNFADLIAISAKNLKGLNKPDAAALSSMFWKATGMYLRANSKAPNKQQEPEMRENADLQVRQMCREEAGKSLRRGLERRLENLLQNPDQEIALALCKKVVLQYTEGLALESEANMIFASYPSFLHNSFKFGQITENILQKINNERQEGLDPTVIKRFREMMQLTDHQCRFMQTRMNAGINAKNKVAATDFYTEQQVIRNSTSLLNAQLNDLNLVELLPNKKEAEIEILNGQKEPLFLCIEQDQKQEFLKKYQDEIKLDPVYHALCVEDLPENRKRFAQFIPRIIEQREAVEKMPVDHQASYQKALKLLQDHGFDVSRGIVINAGHKKFTMDPKNKSRGYIVNIADGGIDRIQIYDFNGSLGEKGQYFSLQNKDEYELAKQHQNELTAEQKAAYAKAEQFRQENREALARAEQNRASKFIRAHSQDLKSVGEYAAFNKHEYLEKKGLDDQDVKGLLFDPSGKSAASIITGLNAPSEQLNKSLAGSLIVPLYNADGKMMSAQIINDRGEKKFARGCSMVGNFFPIGGYDRLKEAKVILVAEGMATAASIQKLAPAGTVVVAAMNCGNLGDVSKALSEKFPNAALGIMADNDFKNSGISKVNAGISHAYMAKNNLSNLRPNITVMTPPFTLTELKHGLTDFNDAVTKQSFDDPEAFKERFENTRNRIAEACGLATMNHQLNQNAIKVAREHLDDHERHMQEVEDLIKQKPHEVLKQEELLYREWKKEQQKEAQSEQSQHSQSSGMHM